MNTMKTRIINHWLRAGFGLVAGALLLAACDDEQFVRDAGQLPAPAGKTPQGALYAAGSFDPQLQDFTISENTVVSLVYRLEFPAESDVTVTLAVGDEYDVNAINDALGIKDGNPWIPMVLAPYKRYHLLPETNFELPASLTLTVPKGEIESTPFAVRIVYDETLLPSQFGKRMLWPWMLPLKVENVEGEVFPAADQVLGIGIRSANMWGSAMNSITWEDDIHFEDLQPKEEDFTFITYCDCREFDPSCAMFYAFGKANFQGEGWLQAVPGSLRFSPLFDIEILHPAFLGPDAKTGMPMVQLSSDLTYVLTHQERYVAPLRKLWMKVCISIETAAKSSVGLCNLSDEERASLIWQIKNLVDTYRLDGVALNDGPANYTAEGAAATDKSSYTIFLKELREVLGEDKLIMVTYHADENAALYEAHDGLQAGDYIDFAWWGTTNEICTPYADAPTVRPIAGLGAKKFSPLLADAVDTDAFKALFVQEDWHYTYPAAVYKLWDLNDAGQCSVLVYNTLRGNIQGFYEGAFRMIPENFSYIPVHEGDMFEKPGWFGQLILFEDDVRYPAHFMGYGGGLKDW